MNNKNKLTPENAWLAEIYDRPGFLLRRCHQMATSIFLEELAEYELTTSQYGAMIMLQHRPGIGQITLSRLLGLDRSTIATVVLTLENNGLIIREVAPEDKRKRRLKLSEKGEALLVEVSPLSKRAQDRLLEPLSSEESQQFLSIVQKLLDAHNDVIRVSLDPNAN